MTDFTMTTDADGVATITWDLAQKSMNVMSTAAFMLLSDLFDRALADPGVKGKRLGKESREALYDAMLAERSARP